MVSRRIAEVPTALSKGPSDGILTGRLHTPAGPMGLMKALRLSREEGERHADQWRRAFARLQEGNARRVVRVRVQVQILFKHARSQRTHCGFGT